MNEAIVQNSQKNILDIITTAADLKGQLPLIARGSMMDDGLDKIRKMAFRAAKALQPEDQLRRALDSSLADIGSCGEELSQKVLVVISTGSDEKICELLVAAELLTVRIADYLTAKRAYNQLYGEGKNDGNQG